MLITLKQDRIADEKSSVGNETNRRSKHLSMIELKINHQANIEIKKRKLPNKTRSVGVKKLTNEPEHNL